MLWGLGVLWTAGLLWTAVCAAAAPGGIGGTGITRGGIGGTGISPGGIGGTGISPGRIGGTGVFTVGPIQRFGSIFVNGTEYALPAETRYRVDGRPASQQSLRLGDLVAVRARVQSGKIQAVEVHVDHAIVGRITHIDRAQGLIRVLGQTVQIMRSTVLSSGDDQPVAFTDLNVGDPVQISALRQDGAHWQALRVQRLDAQTTAQQTPFLLRGRLDAVDVATGRIQVNGVWLPAPQVRQWSALTIGGDVVVRGVQGPAGDTVESVLMQAPVAGEAGLRVVLVGYPHAESPADVALHGLRIQAITAVAQDALRAAVSERVAPAVIIGTMQPDQTVVADQVIPRVNPMVFALPSRVVRPAKDDSLQGGVQQGLANSTSHALSSPATTGWTPLLSGTPTSAPQMPSLPALSGGVSPALTVPVMPQGVPTLPAVTTPSVTPPTVPQIAPPTVTTPTVPTVTAPTVTAPSVVPPSVPSVAPPAVTTPAAPTVPQIAPPTVTTPSVVPPSVPSVTPPAAPAVTPSPITMPTVPSPSLLRP
jgi:hypothetical protein